MIGSLPRGVAVCWVQVPLARFIAVSDRMSASERRVALVMAASRIQGGSHAVLLHESEVARVADRVKDLEAA